MMSNLKKYIDLIERVSKGDILPREFEIDFYYPYMDDKNADRYDENYQDFFDLICEKLDTTSTKIDIESREYGWITYEEFLDWLIEQYTVFQKYRNKQ